MRKTNPLILANKGGVRSDQIRRKSLKSGAAPKLSPKASYYNNRLTSEYDDYGVGGGEGALLESYYFDDDSPVFFQKDAVSDLRKPRGNSTSSNSGHPAAIPMNRNGIAESPLDEKCMRLRYLLEKKEYREDTWKFYHSFMVWKDLAFRDRPDIFHAISVDYIRISKAVNASISDTTMMKVWNKELETALETIFSKFSLLKERLSPPAIELKRLGFTRLFEHTAISRKLDRLAPLALQVMLAVNHRILWQIFCLYCDDKRAIPDPTINKAHPILRLNSTEDGDGGIGSRPMNHAHPWYSKKIVSEDALWQLLMDTRICPSQFGRRQMEKYLRDVIEEAHREAELESQKAYHRQLSFIVQRAPTSSHDEGDEDNDDEQRHRGSRGTHHRTRSNSNVTDSADDNSASSPSAHSVDSHGYPSVSPLASKPSFTEQVKPGSSEHSSGGTSSRIPVRTGKSSSASHIPAPSSSSAGAAAIAASVIAIPSPSSPPTHAAVLGSRSMPQVHPSKSLVSFSTFVKVHKFDHCLLLRLSHVIYCLTCFLGAYNAYCSYSGRSWQIAFECH
jgi:hypothetical protein